MDSWGITVLLKELEAELIKPIQEAHDKLKASASKLQQRLDRIRVARKQVNKEKKEP
jgi:DNA-binding Lrp family transcriptional regulator